MFQVIKRTFIVSYIIVHIIRVSLYILRHILQFRDISLIQVDLIGIQ